MAKRTFSPQHDKKTREKIKTSQLINRLTDFVKVDADQAKTMMTTQQVNAALGLLRKTLPDLSAIEMQADVKAKTVNEVRLTAPGIDDNSTD